MGRLELPRPCERWNLNPVRLPIPPHPLEEGEATLLAYHRAGFLVAADMHDSAVQSSHRHRLQTLFYIRLTRGQVHYPLRLQPAGTRLPRHRASESNPDRRGASIRRKAAQNQARLSTQLHELRRARVDVPPLVRLAFVCQNDAVSGNKQFVYRHAKDAPQFISRLIAHRPLAHLRDDKDGPVNESKIQAPGGNVLAQPQETAAGARQRIRSLHRDQMPSVVREPRYVRKSLKRANLHGPQPLERMRFFPLGGARLTRFAQLHREKETLQKECASSAGEFARGKTELGGP